MVTNCAAEAGEGAGAAFLRSDEVGAGLVAHLLQSPLEPIREVLESDESDVIH